MKKLLICLVVALLISGCSKIIYEASCMPKAALAFSELIERGYSANKMRFAVGDSTFGDRHVQLKAIIDGEWEPIGVAVRQSIHRSGPFSEPKIIMGDGFNELKPETITYYTPCEFFRKYMGMKECAF